MVGLCAILLLGCGTASKEIPLKSQSERTDVFQEVQKGALIPGGFVELTIASSIKTHAEGAYLIESESSLHGKPVLRGVNKFEVLLNGNAIKP